jgi:hypothetical protein
MKDENVERDPTLSNRTAAAPPQEMTAEFHLRAGAFALEAKAGTTSAGLVAAAVLLTSILVPVIFIIRSSKR